MKKLLLILVMAQLSAGQIYANGVAIVNEAQKLCLTLLSSEVDVSVDNQVATVTTIQTFRNDTTYSIELS